MEQRLIQPSPDEHQLCLIIHRGRWVGDFIDIVDAPDALDQQKLSVPRRYSALEPVYFKCRT